MVSVVLLVVLIAVMLGFQSYSAKVEATPEIRYSDFYTLLQGGKIESVTLTGLEVKGKCKGPESVNGATLTSFRTLLPSMDDRELLPLLRDKGAVVNVKSEEQPPAVRVFWSFLPWIGLIAFWWWMSRRAQNMVGAGGRSVG